jgi:outer membrane protein, adhesin transport system
MRTTAQFTFSALPLLMALSSMPLQAQVQTAPQTLAALKAAAEKAVNTNPEVTARFNAYRAALESVDVGQSAYRPKVDLSANLGRDRDRITSRAPETEWLNRSGMTLSATQLLWDGFATRSDVSRLGHDKLARYFEFLDVTEQTTLEAARAHYDVQRYRRLVQLAEDNYVQHKYASLQIQSRFKAGVGRGVDLEQANARLALAESNLATETANLHDVTARYQRVVGEAPGTSLGAVNAGALSKAIPASAQEALTTSIRQSSGISASIEAVRAARSASEAKQSAFQPRVEARLRGGVGHNFEGVRDQRNNATAEVVMNWNLYNGGGDQARVRQQVNVLNQASDLRDKACRDVRQTSVIAFNDTRKLTEQLVYLDRNTLAIEKARDAYRQQFDIGQRSLLDLLNAENEVYTAKRAYANAEADLGIAYARTHASMNQLSSQLGMTRSDSGANETANWAAGDDAPSRCPVMTADITGSDKPALDVRAQRIASTVPPLPAPTPPVVTPITPPAPAMTAPMGRDARKMAPAKQTKKKKKKTQKAL